MPKVRIHDIDLYYEIHGEGKQLLMIAGFSCDCLLWNPILTELSKHFQVIIFDNRGVGRSSAPDLPYSIKQMAEDTFGLINHLKLDKPHLLGHSMGGAIAQHLAYQHAEKFDQLILCNTFCKLNFAACLVEKNVLQMLQNNIPISLIVDTVIPWLYSSNFLKQSNNLEFIRYLLTNPAHPQSVVGFKRQLEALTTFDSTAWVENIKTKTLIINGGEDLICLQNFMTLNEKIQHSQVFHFPHSGHVPFVEEKTLFTEQILQFLKNK